MIAITIDDAAFQRKMRRVGAAAKDGRVPLAQFDRAVKAQMGRAWSRARATGGTVRGQRWDAFKPQYTRKDGTVVPAWGGVQRADGKGMVQGRKRPSKQRVTQQSVINQDIGATRQSVLNSVANIQGMTLLLLGAHLPDYGEIILNMGNRNILRWQLPQDMTTFRRVGNAYLDTLVRRENTK